MARRQSTEWKIEYINSDGDIVNVDYAYNRKDAMAIINRDLDEWHQIDLCKTKSTWSTADEHDIGYEVLSTETYQNYGVIK